MPGLQCSGRTCIWACNRWSFIIIHCPAIYTTSCKMQIQSQMEGHRLQIGCVHSTLQILATCIVRTTRVIWWASKNASDHAHLMNHCGFSPELWEGAVRKLINIDSILLPSLPRSEIVMYNNDVVVSTPHGLITINYNNLAEHPNVQMAMIQVKGESEKPNGSRTFQYAMHVKYTADKAVEGICPRIAPEMCRCMTIEMKVNGCKAYIMIDTGSTSNFVSPAFAKVTGMKIFPLEQQLTLQLGCIGGQSKITHGGKTHIKLGSRTSEIYFDVANINQYNCILGIPFLQEHQAVLNFTNQKVQIGDNTITLLEEVIPDVHLQNPVWLPQNPKWLASPVRSKWPCKGSKGEGGLEKPPKMMSESSKQHLAAITIKEKLTEKDISQLRNWWFWEYKHQLGGMVNRLPPLWEVNHRILLIEESKHYAYHLPHCADVLKQQLSDKIWLYMDANWWIMKSVPQATLMLCIPKKSRKLQTERQHGQRCDPIPGSRSDLNGCHKSEIPLENRPLKCVWAGPDWTRRHLEDGLCYDLWDLYQSGHATGGLQCPCNVSTSNDSDL